jgi:ribosomal protein S27AE
MVQAEEETGLQPARPDMRGRLSTVSAVSKLSSELPSEEEEEIKCAKCGSEEFKVRVLGTGGKEERRLVCGRCGTPTK